MKSQSNTQEHKANQLWQNFKRQDQEKFWQKYEGLMKKQKTYKKASVNHLRSNTNKNESYEEVFNPKSENHFVLIFFIPLFIIIITVGISEIVKNPEVINELSSPLVVFLIFVIYAIGYALWGLNTFYIHTKYLFIKKSLFKVKYIIPWNDIASMEIKTRKNNNQHYHVLIIHRFSAPSRAFNFPLYRRDRDDFIKRMKVKNIAIKDNSKDLGFWEYLFG